MRIRSFVASLAAATLLAAVCAPAALALEKQDWSASALFVQMTGGFSFDTSSASFNLGEATYVTGVGAAGGALRASLGLRPYRWFALGLGYEYQSGLQKQGLDLRTGASQTFSLSNNTIAAQGRLYLPFAFIQPFVLGGVGATFQTATPLLGPTEKQQLGIAQAGVGVDIFITRNVVVVLDSITTFSLGGPFDGQRFTTLGMGAKYRFY